LLATFADDTSVLTKGTDFEEAAVKAQKALLDITNWTKKWRIKLNQQKSVHINFTYKQNKKIQLEINGQPPSNINIIQRFQNKVLRALLMLRGMYEILTYIEI
jgi:hypothetical protein